MPAEQPVTPRPRPRPKAATSLAGCSHPPEAMHEEGERVVCSTCGASAPRPLELTNGATAFSSEWRSPEHKRFVLAVEETEAARRRLFEREQALDPAVEEWARRTLWLTAVWPEGLGYRAGAAEGVGMTVTRLRDVRGELTGELTVRRFGMHLLQQRFNLSSGQARLSTARTLAQHPFGGEGRSRGPVDWREVLEQLSLRILDLERAGEEFTRVGQAPPSSAPPRVIDPYLPDGPTLVWAPQGVGKSTLAAAIVVSLETFTEVIPGWSPTSEMRCLVLDWEASPVEWNDRIGRIAAGLDIEAPSVLYRRPRRPLADQVEAIAAECDREGVGFIVIDSVEKASGATSQGEGYDAKAERLFMALDRIGRPSLLVDHVTGEELRHGSGRVHPKSIGSVLKGAWARATYDLKRDPDASTDTTVQMLLTNVKTNAARREPPFEFAIEYAGDEHTGPIRFLRSRLESPELLQALPMADQLFRLLIRSGAMPTKAIAEALGTTPATIRALLQRDGHRERPRFVRLPDNEIAVAQSEET